MLKYAANMQRISVLDLTPRTTFTSKRSGNDKKRDLKEKTFNNVIIWLRLAKKHFKI
jgi:hypothetical protein